MRGQLLTKFYSKKFFFFASPTADTQPLERKVKVRRDFAKHTLIEKKDYSQDMTSLKDLKI